MVHQVDGRPAQPGARDQSGRRRELGDPRAPTLWRRIRDDGIRAGLDPRLGTELSRLSLFGELTDTHVETGFRIAEIYGRYERAKRKRRHSVSPSYVRAYGDLDAGEDELDPIALKRLEAAIRKAERNWKALQKAIDGLPCDEREARALLERVCVEDQRIDTARLNDLRFVLTELAGHFSGRTSQVPSAISARRQTRRRLGSEVTAVRARRSELDRQAFLQVQGILRPDLSEADRLKAWDIWCALKARAMFRRSKGDGR